MNPVIWIEPTGEALTRDVPQTQLNSGGVVSTVSSYTPILLETLAPAVRYVVDAVAAAVRPSADGPESCEVKFALKVSGEGNVILAKMGSELSLEVKVVWKRAEPPKTV